MDVCGTELALIVGRVGRLLELSLLDGKLICRRHVAGACRLISCGGRFARLLTECVCRHLLSRLHAARLLHVANVELSRLKRLGVCLLRQPGDQVRRLLAVCFASGCLCHALA